MFKKMNLWGILKEITSPKKSHSERVLLRNIKPALDESYLNYQKKSQEEKDKMCVDIAQRMGCRSDKISDCEKYIYEYAYSSKAG